MKVHDGGSAKKAPASAPKAEPPKQSGTLQKALSNPATASIARDLLARQQAAITSFVKGIRA